MPRKKKDDGKGNWIVTMRCVVTKSVYLEGCTEEEASNNPWEFAVDEHEVEQIDWDVMRIERTS